MRPVDRFAVDRAEPCGLNKSRSMHNFRKLNVYCVAKQIVKEIYLLLEQFPQNERFVLADQLRRAAISIPSNIAEGLGRGTDKDRAHFMQIAYGSLMEVLAQLDIACDIGYLPQEEFERMEKLIVQETKLLQGMINKFKTQKSTASI